MHIKTRNTLSGPCKFFKKKTNNVNYYHHHDHLIYSSHQLYQVGSMSSLMVQIWKLTPREIKYVAKVT